MTAYTGVLVSIVDQALDAAIDADADAGDIVLHLSDVLDFAEDGGRLQVTSATVDGETTQAYDYVTVDDETSTITLASGLLFPAEVADAVEILTSEGDVATEWVAIVESSDQTDSDEPLASDAVVAAPPIGDEPPVVDQDVLEVLIPADKRRGWVLGDEQAGALVTFADDGRGGFEVTNVPGTRTTEDEVNLPQGSTSNLRGNLTARAGVTAPLKEPTVTPAWDEPAYHSVTTIDPGAGVVRGLLDNGGTWLSTLSDTAGSSVLEISKTDGATTSRALPADFRPLGGIAVLDTTTWVLGRDRARNDEWWIYFYDASFAKTGEAFFSSDTTITSAALCVSNGAVVAVFTRGAQLLASYRQTNGGLAKSVTLSNSWASLVTAAWAGAADLGATRFLIGFAGGVRGFSNTDRPNGGSEARVAADWSTPPAQGLGGLTWSAGRFHMIATGTADVWHFAAVPTTATRADIRTTRVHIADGHPELETTTSPATSYVQPARHPFRVVPAAVPDVVSDYAPTGIRVYIAGQRQAEQPDRLDHVVDAPETGGAAPPPTNGFLGYVDAGHHQSEAADSRGPIWEISGDGDGTMGPLSWDMKRSGVPVSPMLTVATGWSVVSAATEEHGLHKQGRIVFQRTGADFAVGTRGDFANLVLATVAVGWRPGVPVPATAGAIGRTASSEIRDNGQIVLGSVAGSADVVTGEQIAVTFAYFARGA